MTEIKNTTRAMREDPAEPLLALAEGMATGSASSFVERQEADGQRQLVNSDRLPTDTGHDGDEPFLALGFTFGEPDERDPMFRAATLPAGWRREGSDHAMWSYIADEHGRRRVAIFYKAAFYDRSAFMRLETLYGYVTQAVEYHGTPVVFDEQWATLSAVADVMADARDKNLKQADFWREGSDERHVADYTERAAKFGRALAALEAGNG